MDIRILKELENFDFKEYFGVTMHTVTFDNTNWKTDDIIADFERGIRALKWCAWNKNADLIIVKFKL